MNLAVILGRFLGAVLAECGPVLAEILSHAIREGLSDTVEDGARRDDLRQRLLERVRTARLTDGNTTQKCDAPPGGSAKTP